MVEMSYTLTFGNASVVRIRAFWVKTYEHGIEEWHGVFSSGAEAVEYCLDHDYLFDIWYTLGKETFAHPTVQVPVPWMVVSKEAEEYVIAGGGE